MVMMMIFMEPLHNYLYMWGQAHLLCLLCSGLSIPIRVMIAALHKHDINWTTVTCLLYSTMHWFLQITHCGLVAPYNEIYTSGSTLAQTLASCSAAVKQSTIKHIYMIYIYVYTVVDKSRLKSFMRPWFHRSPGSQIPLSYGEKETACSSPESIIRLDIFVIWYIHLMHMRYMP